MKPAGRLTEAIDTLGPTAVLLEASLALAVPLHILELQSLPFVELQRIAHAAADVVAEKGDVIQFRGRKGESAAAFNALARGLAAASFCPGGINFLGMHFQTPHPEVRQE